MNTKLSHVATLGALALACGTPDAIDYGDSAHSGDSESGDAGGFCGDGIVQDGESCDDGNADDADACHDDCTVPGGTLWLALVEDSVVLGMAATSEHVFALGRDASETTWIAAFDRDGNEGDMRSYPATAMVGMAGTKDDRLLFPRYLQDEAKGEICTREAPADQDHCVLAEWDGEPITVGAVDAGFGRTATTTFSTGTFLIHELEPVVGVVGQIAFTPEPDNYSSRHAFTSTGHVVAQLVGETLEVQWLDAAGMPGEQVEVAVPPEAILLHLSVSDDERLALTVAGNTVAETRTAMIGPGGQIGPTIPAAGQVRGTAFAENGDLFTLELTGGENGADLKVELARWSPEGEERWRRAWTDAEESPDSFLAGPDGTLYASGTRYEGGDAIAFVRAMRP